MEIYFLLFKKEFPLGISSLKLTGNVHLPNHSPKNTWDFFFLLDENHFSDVNKAKVMNRKV